MLSCVITNYHMGSQVIKTGGVYILFSSQDLMFTYQDMCLCWLLINFRFLPWILLYFRQPMACPRPWHTPNLFSRGLRGGNFVSTQSLSPILPANSLGELYINSVSPSLLTLLLYLKHHNTRFRSPHLLHSLHFGHPRAVTCPHGQ